jgi:hypothetical protein
MPGDRFDQVRVNPRRVTVGAETTPSSISPTVAGARLAPLWFSNSSVPSSSPPARLAVLVGVVDEQYRHRFGRERLDALGAAAASSSGAGTGIGSGAGGTGARARAQTTACFLPKAQRADGHDWQSQLRTLISHGHSRCELRRRRDDASTTWPVSCGAHRQNGAAGGHRMALAELGVEPPTIRLLINSCMLCTAGVGRPRRPILFGRMRRRSLGIGAAFVWRSGPWALWSSFRS